MGVRLRSMRPSIGNDIKLAAVFKCQVAEKVFDRVGLFTGAVRQGGLDKLPFPLNLQPELLFRRQVG